MKKILALALSVLLLLGLCACKEREAKKEHSVDIEYYADLGQIPESQFMLGDTGETVKKALEKAADKDEEDHSYFDEQIGENNVFLTDGTYEYYYKKAAPEKGIAYIVSYTDAYGFKLGDVILEVKEALSGYNVEELAVNSENAFFYFGDTSAANLLKVEFQKNTVMFLFENNALTATVIYSNENWN